MDLITTITGALAMQKYLLIILVLASTNSVAAVNKWVDSKDRVHYSDQPPPLDAKSSTPAKTKTSDSEDAAGKGDALPASTPAVPKTVAEQEAEWKKVQQAKKEAADKAAKKQVEANIMKSNCASAQQSLRAMQSGVRIAEVDAKGERSFLSDEQRQQRTAQAQQAVNSYCK